MYIQVDGLRELHCDATSVTIVSYLKGRLKTMSFTLQRGEPAVADFLKQLQVSALALLEAPCPIPTNEDETGLPIEDPPRDHIGVDLAKSFVHSSPGIPGDPPNKR
jgi:hypothetical protein